jgi:hypothetical protein
MKGHTERSGGLTAGWYAAFGVIFVFIVLTGMALVPVSWGPSFPAPTPGHEGAYIPAARAGLEPPAVPLPTVQQLLDRGETREPQAFLGEMEAALVPFRAGNYGAAADGLEKLTHKWPASPEAHFYLGASLLLAGRGHSAEAPLVRAFQRAKPPLKETVQKWLAEARK